MNKRSSSKDNTSYLFNRYVWLVDLIHRNESITFEEIDNHWQRSSLNWDGSTLPLRTFHNHRQAIEQMFDINIECNKQNGFRYYIDGKESLEQDGARSWLLNSLAINNILSESRQLKERIIFEKIPSGQKYLTTILEAMKENKVIEITYQNFWREKAYTFLVHPYCIKVFRQRWYLISYSPSKEKILIYSLDRIQNISITDDKFVLPDNFSGEEYFYNSFGIIVEDELKPEVVSLKVAALKDKYINSLPLHHSQQSVESNAYYTIFNYYLRPSFDFIQEILSHGADVEVLKPEWLREEIRKTITLQYNKYKEGK